MSHRAHVTLQPRFQRLRALVPQARAVETSQIILSRSQLLPSIRLRAFPLECYGNCLSKKLISHTVLDDRHHAWSDTTNHNRGILPISSAMHPSNGLVKQDRYVSIGRGSNTCSHLLLAVANSGGPDSTALLFLLNALLQERAGE